MKSPLLPSLLLALGACASPATHSAGSATAPSITGLRPSLMTADDRTAPDTMMLPAGVGLSAGPAAFLLAGSLDLPLTDRLTVGPSVEYGWDNNTELATITGQVKLFLQKYDGEAMSWTLLPYLCGGAGFVNIDKDGRPSDSGFLFTAGAGVRLLTGAHYRIGSEARANLLPDRIAGDHFFMTYELLQFVFTF